MTGLPPDAEPDEIVERFSRCGLIEEDDEGHAILVSHQLEVVLESKENGIRDVHAGRG